MNGSHSQSPFLPVFCRVAAYGSSPSSFGFHVESLTHLELIFVQGHKHRSTFILLYVSIQVPSTICWRCCLSSAVCFGIYVNFQIPVITWMCLGLVYCSIDLHVYFCAFTMLVVLLYLCNITWNHKTLSLLLFIF